MSYQKTYTVNFFFHLSCNCFDMICPSQLPIGCLFLSVITQVFANSFIVRCMLFSRNGSFCNYLIFPTSSSFSCLYLKTCFAIFLFVELSQGLRENGFWSATASARSVSITGWISPGSHDLQHLQNSSLTCSFPTVDWFIFFHPDTGRY